MNMFNEHRLNAFAGAHPTTLAVALNLERIWRHVLEEPVPEDLRRLINRLEEVQDHACQAPSETAR
jgi:hypothetical protein